MKPPHAQILQPDFLHDAEGLRVVLQKLPVDTHGWPGRIGIRQRRQVGYPAKIAPVTEAVLSAGEGAQRANSGSQEISAVHGHLKVKFQRNLSNSRILCGEDAAALRWQFDIGVRIVELRVVERIESLRAELQRYRFRETEVLEDRKVPIVETRPAKDISTRISDRVRLR